MGSDVFRIVPHVVEHGLYDISNARVKPVDSVHLLIEGPVYWVLDAHTTVRRIPHMPSTFPPLSIDITPLNMLADTIENGLHDVGKIYLWR